MNKIMIWLVVLLSIINIAYAADGGYVNNSVTIQADIFQQPNYFDADAANATIRDPDGNIFIANLSLTNVSEGYYIGNFTPNVTGNWYVSVEYFNQTNQRVYIASGTYYIKESIDQMMEGINVTFNSFTIILGIGILLFLICYLVFTYLGDEHIVLKSITLIYSIIVGMVLIPKSTLDAIAGTNSSTANIFFNSGMWYITILGGYILIFVIYKLFTSSDKVIRFVERLKR